MKIEIGEKDFGGKDGVLYTPIIDGETQSSYFKTHGEAIIYAGLAISDISRNDCNYISGYIGHMVRSIAKGE